MKIRPVPLLAAIILPLVMSAPAIANDSNVAQVYVWPHNGPGGPFIIAPELEAACSPTVLVENELAVVDSPSCECVELL